jgi:hypothetical protein
MLDGAYKPILEDDRGIFTEDLRVKAPGGSHEVIAAAAHRKQTTRSEWIDSPFCERLRLMA